MKLIAHRGNMNGPNPEKENNPDYIVEALNNGFEVEIDVWYKHGDVWLGHDDPTYPVDVQFIQLPMFWCHAKNLDALHYMIDANINCFWHQEDERTLTSKGFIWTYPGKEITEKSVICLQNETDQIPKGCYGICSDWVGKYKR